MSESSEDYARETLRRAADRGSLRAIARDVGVSHTTLYDFLGGASWSDRTERLLMEWIARVEEDPSAPADEVDNLLEYAGRVVRFAKGGGEMSKEKHALALDILKGLIRMAKMDGKAELARQMERRWDELGPAPDEMEPDKPSAASVISFYERESRAAEQRAIGMKEWAVAVRIAEEEAKARRGDVSSVQEALEIAAQGTAAVEYAAAVDRERRRAGQAPATPAPGPEKPSPDPSSETRK